MAIADDSGSVTTTVVRNLDYYSAVRQNEACPRPTYERELVSLFVLIERHLSFTFINDPFVDRS